MSNPIPEEVREAMARAAFKENVIPGVVLNDDAWELSDAYKKAIYLNMIDAALSALEAAGFEVNRKGTLENVRAELTARAKEMQSARDTLIWVRDELEDEGDRVYFGSTNHADQFREVVESMDEWSWHDKSRWGVRQDGH